MGRHTRTMDEQMAVEAKLLRAFAEPKLTLHRGAHHDYLLKGLRSLPAGFVSLDASRPWLCYWILHSLDLLEIPLADGAHRVVEWLKRLQQPGGGFGGGPMQLAHLAPTYAATNSLIILGTREAYEAVDRAKLYKWLLSVKDPVSGGFCMHVDGEVDIRGTYCALAVASLLNMLTPELTEGVARYIASCQTYEGGLGGFPGNEAHGGYTFCGFAAAILSKSLFTLDIPRLLHWVSDRQMAPDCGFQGRTNKLVDGCYSYWQGAVFPLIDLVLANGGQTIDASALLRKYGDGEAAGGHLGIHSLQAQRQAQLAEEAKKERVDGVAATQEAAYAETGDWLFDQHALQRYLLLASQDPNGGFRDKPGKNRDYYHTCYCFSGLSIAENNRQSTSPLGPSSTLLPPVNPIYNIRRDKVQKAFDYFKDRPLFPPK